MSFIVPEEAAKTSQTVSLQYFGFLITSQLLKQIRNIKQLI